MLNNKLAGIPQKLLSSAPACLTLLGCFAYSAFQVLSGQIELDTGDASKYATIALYMAADVNLSVTEQLDHVGALANSAVFALLKTGAEAFSLGTTESSAVFLLGNLLSSYALAFIGWLYVRREAGEYAAFLAITALVGNQFFVNHSLNTYAEPMGAMLVLLAAYTAVKAKSETKGVLLSATLLLMASLFRHEYFLFGWYLAAWLCIKKKYGLAGVAASVSSLFYLSKRLYQGIFGSKSADYQAWLDHPLESSVGERFTDGIGVLQECFRIDFLPLGSALALLSLTWLSFVMIKRRKKPSLLMTFMICHSGALLLFWASGIVPHTQQRYASVVEYLFPFALGCSLAEFHLVRTIAFEKLRSYPFLILLPAIFVAFGLALWTHRAEVYNVRFNRIPEPIVKTRNFLKENIKDDDKLYFGYGQWTSYLQNKCYEYARLGNSYAYSNEGFYGLVPLSLRNSSERSEDASRMLSTRHRDLQAVLPDYLIVSKLMDGKSITKFLRKRGAGAIGTFMHSAEGNPSMHRWFSPHVDMISPLFFTKVFENEAVIIFHAKAQESS